MRKSRSILVSAAAAAPALVLLPDPAGAAVITPQAVPGPAEAQAFTARLAPALPREYSVRSGDTVWSVSERFCGTGKDYTGIAAASHLGNASDIFPGELLTIACKAAARALSGQDPDPAPAADAARVTSVSGTLGCSGLEALWEEARGAADEAFTAAEVAMAESGGRQYALSPTDDLGYWQIHGSWGPEMATYDPVLNAEAAVKISGDGSNWSAWTTFASGAYQGRC